MFPGGLGGGWHGCLSFGDECTRLELNDVKHYSEAFIDMGRMTVRPMMFSARAMEGPGV